MKPLIVLSAAFASSLLILRAINGGWDLQPAGNIAMSAMLLFTATGHFVFTNGMEMMIPPFIPFRKAMVYLTGFVEAAAAVGLLLPGLRGFTAVLLLVFLCVVLPCNIYAAFKKVNYQESNYSGPGTRYLWFRVPMQLLLIAWVIVFSLCPDTFLQNG